MSVQQSVSRAAVMSSTVVDQSQARSILKIIEGMEEKYDPDGKVSGACRPILNQQREKLVKILVDKKEETKKTSQDHSTDRRKSI